MNAKWYKELNNIPWFHYLEPLYAFGPNAVQLFWAISGFVFMHVYAGRHNTISSREFFVNRMARLYPLHFITLMVMLILQTVNVHTFGHYSIYQLNDAYHFILNLFFASAWGFQSDISFNGPIWSVSVEVLIYFCFFLFFKSVSINLASITIAFLMFASTFYVFKNIILFCGMYFFAGAMAYSFRKLLSPLPRKTFAITTTVMLGLSILFIFIAEKLLEKNIPRSFLLISLFITLILFFTAVEDMLGEAIFRKVRSIGDITYSSYLWHAPLQVLFFLLVSFGLINLNVIFKSWFLMAYLALTCLFSWVSFKYIENPSKQMIKKLLLTHPVHSSNQRKAIDQAISSGILEKEYSRI